MQTDTSPSVKAQIVYFSHGGGPLPILGDANHGKMVAFMQELPGRLRRPDAILVISAHWEEGAATLPSGSEPPMFYDYSGFPEEAYSIQYPALSEVERDQYLINWENATFARYCSPRGVFVATPCVLCHGRNAGAVGG